MILNNFLLVFVLGLHSVISVNMRYSPFKFRSRPGFSCPWPVLKNGRIRQRLMNKVVRFGCLPGFELVGNKYAHCSNGHWDTQTPVCIRPGCSVPDVKNSIPITTRESAYVMFFCQPGYKLQGSHALFCDGENWNASTPSCVSSNSTVSLSCDFEAPDLCGWSQDRLHDFDWTRLNKRTPSSFLYTGPSADHTLGVSGGTGYFMYIESSSRSENDSARLLSPIFDKSLAKDGCFSFYYHMYGRSIGGLRVYQKPDKIDLETLLNLSAVEKDKHILFERWGNVGDEWIRYVANLTDVADDFQGHIPTTHSHHCNSCKPGSTEAYQKMALYNEVVQPVPGHPTGCLGIRNEFNQKNYKGIVIEGIRGKSVTSDIAIDDVAVLQGASCAVAMDSVVSTTATISYDSCSGRCNDVGKRTDCSCNDTCIIEMTCCSDFFDFCFLADSTTPVDVSSTMASLRPKELPQTQKLVGSTPGSKVPETTYTKSIKTLATTRPTKPLTTTTKLTTSTTPATTIKITTTKLKVMTSKAKLTPIPTTKSTINPTTMGTKAATKSKVTAKPVKLTTAKATTILTVGISRKFENHDSHHDLEEKVKMKQEIESMATEPKVDAHKSSSSGVKVTAIVISTLFCLVAVAYAAVYLRSERGRNAIARLHGRARADPEVRFLTSEVDCE